MRGEAQHCPGRIAAGVYKGGCDVRVMDRLPHPADRIDETLIRVEWPDPTGKCRDPRSMLAQISRVPATAQPSPTTALYITRL